jgi:hypothetical protein
MGAEHAVRRDYNASGLDLEPSPVNNEELKVRVY